MVLIEASSSTQYERLPDVIEASLAQEDRVCVHLEAAHFSNLSSALTAFVGQVSARLVTLETAEAQEPQDLLMLSSRWLQHDTIPQIVLLVHNMESLPSAVLSDTLQAITSWALGNCGGHRVPLHVVFTYSASLPALPRPKAHHASQWLLLHVHQRVMDVLDVSTQAWPDKSDVWEQAICPFFMAPATGLWLGRSIFEMVRRRYWHTSASWDSVVQTVRLCYHHHFSGRPLSAFMDGSVDEPALEAHWTEELTSRFRLELLSAYPPGEPLPASLAPAFTDNHGMLAHLAKEREQFETDMTHRTLALMATWCVLRAGHMTGVYGIKLGFTACCAAVLTWEPPHSDWDASRAPVFAQTPTTPSFSQLASSLRHTCATLNLEQIRYFIAQLQAQCSSLLSNYSRCGAAVLEDALKALAHLLDIASRTDESDARPNTLTSEFTELVHTWWMRASLPISPLGATVWTFDFAEPVSAALEGASRANVILALDAPTETLASMEAATMAASGQRELPSDAAWPEWDAHISEVDYLQTTTKGLASASVPDVCRLFSLYKDSSKFINLADWYEAFVQSLEGDQKRRELNQEIDSPEAEASTPVRFSLALNELAHMGFLGPTSRKIEHLGRTIWDLTVEAPDDRDA